MNPSPTRNRWRDWLWPVLVALTIFGESTQSQVAGPSIPHIDKVAHFFVYGLLATLLIRVPAVARAGRWGVVGVLLFASAYGVSDEFHQSFTPGRSVEFLDWLADTCGAALAVAVYLGWSGYRRFLEFPVHADARVDLPAGGASD